MRRRIIFKSLIALMVIFVSSCSLVKDPSASTNFRRVKYNSHVKLRKSNMQRVEAVSNENQLPKTVLSFTKENLKEENFNNIAVAEKNTDKKEFVNHIGTKQSVVKAEKLNKLLKNISAIQIKKTKTIKTNSFIQKRDYWWEDDVEDWPWLEIVLAAIAILVIAILASILVSVLGGLISSLFGLILLIVLAYILYTLWF